MNNRQAGAFREMIRKEEKSRENWLRENGSRFGLTAGPDGEPIPLPQDQMQTTQELKLRTVKVPFTRKVKVPVKTQRIVPVRVQRRVPTKRVVEVDGFKEVEETYTEVQERPAIRKKAIYIKKMVPERYVKRVEVPRTRRVRVPVKVKREVDDFDTVSVVEQRPVEVQGYRVDELQESKVMEVPPGHPHYNLPSARQSANPSSTRRVRGNQVYHPEDERVVDLAVDYDQPASRSTSRIGKVGSAIVQKQKPRPKKSSRKPALSSRRRAMAPPAKIGLRLAEGHEQGCVVSRVNRGGSSDQAGLQVQDVVMYVNNRPTRNKAEFKEIISSNNGPLYLTVKRRGAGKLKLTVMR